IEGKLGGQAKVPGASGTWKDLTDNVNQLAGNLTSQVRAIAEVSTAVTKGDLTRQVTVEAEGEVAALKDNINQMIGNLKDTTQKNTEQDWLKTNLAKFSGMMQGQRSITSVAQLIMSELTPLVDAHQGTFFMSEADKEETPLNLIASYAFNERRSVSNKYRLKEGLIGQCAFEKKRILLTQPDDEIGPISSSLMQVRAKNIIVLPVLFEGELKAVIELASVKEFSQNYINFLDQLMDSIGVILNMISSSMRTEELLQELKRSNAELEAQAKELEDKAKLLEVKNQEVELASRSLEEKAEQLSLISKYKSEFLANMSHELRTPLNSLLILSKTLANNKDLNLNADQVKYASTIHSSGQDLLALINEILDLSKVEAGKMPVNPKEVETRDIQEYLEQTFRPVAEHKGLEFVFEKSADLPKNLFTDENRLQQILKNLLSNAFKFTDKGTIRLRMSLADKSASYPYEPLNRSKNVIVFSVTDTGIGIPLEKQKLIFEAFQQADGTTSRKYGGTGLGLTISREIARLLGGLIRVESEPGSGSTFHLLLPQKYMGSDANLSSERHDSDALTYEPMPKDASFRGKTVLIVDDDMRNIFALSTVLKQHDMEVLYAENGKYGIDALKENPGVDLVLMDTMMPEMDGLEAIRRIREMPNFVDLPIVSVTAKAMKGDREKCLAAGASDYVTKPVDESHLMSVIYRWLNPMKTSHTNLTSIADSEQPQLDGMV
ncbi:MAG: ATP-binding protein, partial [Bdellovibrionota bacterium]